MKLESLDRTSLETDTYWVASVVMSSGPLLLLRYDGYDDDRSGDFWCDAASEDLQPIGWCARTNNILIPPVGRSKLFNRAQLKQATFLSHGRQFTRSELFAYLTSLHATTFILLSIFSLAETISLKIWERLIT